MSRYTMSLILTMAMNRHRTIVPVDLRTRWCKDRKEIAVKGFSLKFKLRRSDGERRTSNRNGLH